MTFKFATLVLAAAVALSGTSAFGDSHKQTHHHYRHHHYSQSMNRMTGPWNGGMQWNGRVSDENRYGGPGTGLSGTGPSTFGGGGAGMH